MSGQAPQGAKTCPPCHQDCDQGRGCPARPSQQPAPEADVVVSWDEQGQIVAVTRQDEEGRILSVIAESAPEQAEGAKDDPPTSPGFNLGHGHVFSRPDGVRARCGGPALCKACAKDLALKDARVAHSVVPDTAWLIEWQAHGHGPQWWGFNHAPGKSANWCADANNAIRFSRREDAERMRLHVIAVAGFSGRPDYQQQLTVTEHMWPAAAPQAAQSGMVDERAAFEAWIRKDSGDLRTFGQGSNMHYLNSAVNNAWTGWQTRAALAAAPQAVPNPCAKIFDHKWLDPECVEGGCQSLAQAVQQPQPLTDEQLRKLGNKRAIFQAGRDSYQTPAVAYNTDDEAWDEYLRSNGITAKGEQ